MNCSALECPRDCPVIKNFSAELTNLEKDLLTTKARQAELEALEARNRKTADRLSKLPNSQDAALTRGILQESVIHTASAKMITSENFGLLNLAININKEDSEAYLSSCTAQPYYVEHPSNPGQMILTCASNYINEI